MLVWDLRRIRDQLAPMGLDWDAPPYPTAPAASDAAGPLPPPRPVRVVGEVIEPQARRAAELAEMNRRLAAKPDDAEALIHRGWLFTQQKKWPEAIADLEQLLRLRPGDSDASWLLAEAYQETGNLAGALVGLGPIARTNARRSRGPISTRPARPGLRPAGPGDGRFQPHPRRRTGSGPCALPPGAGPDPAWPSPRGTGRPRHPHPERPERLRAVRPPRHRPRGPRRSRASPCRQEKASSLLPKDPTALNDRAWIAATGPITQRDPERAVALARRAVALAPGQQLTLNTLGVALYRAGQYAEAISVLEQSLAAGKGEFDAFDLFFLAMAHQKLGHASQARACFDRAVRWWGEQKNLPAQYVPELTGFRAEAEELLAGTRAELPADVFAPE